MPHQPGHLEVLPGITQTDLTQRRSNPFFQFNDPRSLLDPSMIGGGQARTFKLHLIYPKKKESEQPGQVYDAPAGTGRGNYAHTGDWRLSSKEQDLLESRIRRSLEESGVKIEPGMTVYDSPKGVDEYRTNWGPPTAELGIGNHEYPDEVVPVYLIRGLGAYAGGQPGANFQNSYYVIGDGVIEALAGFKGVNGRRAYEIIKSSEGQQNPEFYGSYQSQMGTVLHEGLHAVAALPHRDEGDLQKGMLQDYAENYAGAHGEKFARAIDDSLRGEAGTDRFAAMNLIMNEPWNYGWGTSNLSTTPGTSDTLLTETVSPTISPSTTREDNTMTTTYWDAFNASNKSPVEIQQMVVSGQITRDQAITEFNRRGWPQVLVDNLLSEQVLATEAQLFTERRQAQLAQGSGQAVTTGGLRSPDFSGEAEKETEAAATRELYEIGNLSRAQANANLQRIYPESTATTIRDIVDSWQVPISTLGVGDPGFTDDITEDITGAFPTVVPTAVSTPAPGVPVVPVPTPMPVDAPADRAKLFRAQQGDVLTRRLLGDVFGPNRTPLLNRAARNVYSDWANIDPLLDFRNQGQTLGQRFQSFADTNRLDREALNTSLDALMGDPNFLSFVPDYETAARLGMAPGLAGVNPRLRDRTRDRWLEEFETARAMSPELYQGKDFPGLADRLQAEVARFRQKGFFSPDMGQMP